MKKLIGTLLLFLMLSTGKAQNCITVNWSYFDNPSGDNIHWRLLVNWSANGTKHLKTIVTNYGDTILNECYQVRSSSGAQTGTFTYNITVPNGRVNFVGKFKRFTGTCGNGTECDGEQTLVNNILPIRVTEVSAKNIGNSTEVMFRVQTIDGYDNIVTLNMLLKNGSNRQFKIKMPDDVRPGQIWKITINNLTGEYKTNKL
jgi:hypothetical protein